MHGSAHAHMCILVPRALLCLRALMRAHPGARRHTATFNADERPHAEAEPPGCFSKAEAAFSVPGSCLGRIPTHAKKVRDFRSVSPNRSHSQHEILKKGARSLEGGECTRRQRRAYCRGQPPMPRCTRACCVESPSCDSEEHLFRVGATKLYSCSCRSSDTTAVLQPRAPGPQRFCLACLRLMSPRGT